MCSSINRAGRILAKRLPTGLSRTACAICAIYAIYAICTNMCVYKLRFPPCICGLPRRLRVPTLDCLELESPATLR